MEVDLSRLWTAVAFAGRQLYGSHYDSYYRRAHKCAMNGCSADASMCIRSVSGLQAYVCPTCAANIAFASWVHNPIRVGE